MSKIFSLPIADAATLERRKALIAAEDAAHDAVIGARRGVDAAKPDARAEAEKLLADRVAARQNLIDSIAALEAEMPNAAPASLTRAYDRYAKRVLIQKNIITTIQVTKGSGDDAKTVERIVVLAPLPTVEEYRALRDETYTTTVDTLVSDAFSIYSDLRDELDEWFNNLPENFQNGSKGDEITEAKDMLDDCANEEFSIDDFPLTEIKAVRLPDDASSRADRCAEACANLRTAAEALNDAAETLRDLATTAEKKPWPAWLAVEAGSVPTPQDLESWAASAEEAASKCEEVADNAEGISFPGMY